VGPSPEDVLTTRARRWWNPPRLRSNDPGNTPRRVTWLELFFDLVFVIVIGQLTHKLSGEISFTGFLHFVFLFVPAWWVWVAGSYYVEYWETDDVSMRMVMFALMLPVVGLALFVHDALEASVRGYALSYASARVVIAFLFARAGRYDARSRTIAWSYAAGFLTVAVLITCSLFVSHHTRITLWVIALLTEFLMPVVLTLGIRNQLPHRRETSKLPERFGLFTIIVLGETVVNVFQGLWGVHDITPGLFMTGALGMAMAFEWWGIYFDFVAQRRIKEGIWWEWAWGYLHLGLVMSMVAVGACLSQVMKSGDSALPANVKWLLVGATAMSLVMVTAIEWTLSPSGSHRPPRGWPKMLVAASIVVLGLTGQSIGAARLLGIIVALLLIPTIEGSRAWLAQASEQ